MNNPHFQPNGGPRQANAGLQHFVQHYRNQLAQGKLSQGWQQSVSPEERGQLGLQFFTQYRLLKPDMSEMEAMRASVNFEQQALMAAQSKDQYVNNIKQKLMMMTQARQVQLHRMQGNMGQMNNGMNAMNPAQMGMMGQPNLAGPRQQGTPQQFNNPAFPNAQLQRPMQISPVPMSQAQSSMGVNNANPANLPHDQNQPQQNIQQGQQNRNENIAINQFARRLMESCKDEIRQKFQQEVATWSNEKKQQLVSQGIDPLFFRFRQHADMLYRKGALNNIQQGGNANQMQPGAQNRMANQMNANQQRQSNQDFDLHAITSQQMEAMRVQDQGATVVPASNNMNGAQMNGFNGQNSQQPQNQNAAMAQRQAEAAAFQQRQQHAQQQAAQAQAQAHAQLEQQRQRQAAANRTPNQLLTGLNGGLNMPTNSQSPGPMSMLNRPMHPPGQPGPPTPQQQPQNHVPVMTPRPGQLNNDQQTALMREAAMRANAVNAVAHQPLTEHVRLGLMPADIDPSLKAQLLKVPEQQFRSIIMQYKRTNTNPNAPMFGLQQNQPQQNPLLNQQMPPQPGMPNHMMGGPNMSRPGMNVGQQMLGGGQQPPIGQRPPQAVTQQQRLAHAHNILRQNPGVIHATDPKPYPLTILNPQIQSNVPPEVKTWGQLKQWATQNPGLLPGVSLEKLMLLQVLHFQDLIKQQQMQAPQQNNTPNFVPPPQMNGNQGPVRTPHPQPNMQGMPPVQVTPQELQQWRGRLPPQNAGMPDEQLRQIIMRQKAVAGLRQQQQAQHQQQQQQERQQAQQHMMAAQQNNQRAAAAAAINNTQQQPQPQPPNRPPTTQPQNAQNSGQQKAAARPQQTNQPNQLNAANNKGVKRPNDDAADMTADGATTTAAPQAPAMVPTKSSAGLGFTQEQMSKMTPAQQAQMKAQLLKAQDASNANGSKPQPQQRPVQTSDDVKNRMMDPVRVQAFNQIIGEVERSLPPRQVLQWPQQQRAALQQSVKDNLINLKKMEQALRIFHVSYEGAESEGLIRQVAKARALVFQQLNIQDGTINDQVTLGLEEFKTHLRTMIGFYQKVMSRMSQLQNRTGAQQTQPQPTQGANAPPAQLNAANLKIVEQQQRQQKAPSAPTTDRPPFALGDQSARGAPTYFEGAKTVTNLVLPDKKRTKLDPVSQTSTPGPKASPRIGTGKGHSPELTRQPPPDKQVPQKPTYRCKSSDCEYSVRGFDTQAELDSHFSQVHAVIDNPMQFALESLADYLDVDPKTGESKVDPNASKRLAKTAPAASRATQATSNVPLSAGTPAGIQAAATPMARVPTQTGMKGSPVANFLKTPQTMGKVATPGSGAHAKATPTSMPRPVPKEQQAVAAAEPVREDEQEPLLPMSLLDYSYEDTFAALDANGPFTALDLKDEDTTWALRSRPASPMTTPDSSAKDTPSTRTSDISENDNIHINLDIGMDVPDAWTMEFGNALPIPLQLSEDMQNLGVQLPPMDNEDLALFPSYTDGLMDYEMLEKTLDSMNGSLDISGLAQR